MPILKPEYQNILNTAISELRTHKLGEPDALIRDLIERFFMGIVVESQAIADKPVKRLSDEQISELIKTAPHPNWPFWLCRGAEEAFIKLQQEPEEEIFKFDEWFKGGWQAILIGGNERHEVDMIYPIDDRGEKSYYVMRKKS